MKIRDIMTHSAPRIPVDCTIRDAAEELSVTQCSDLVVVDDDNNFLGVLSEGDLIRSALPDIQEVISAGDTLSNAYDLFVEAGQANANKSFKHLIIKSPIIAHPDDEVLRIASIMVTRQIRRLPVVENGKLVGSVSRADVCRKVMTR
jgi:CBS domain-containing protein